MCLFTLSNGSACTNVVNDEFYCKDHENMECAICRKQASHSCARSNLIGCDSHLCSAKQCQLTHLYMFHPEKMAAISNLENDLLVPPQKILVGVIDIREHFPNSLPKFKAGFLTKINSNWITWSTICVEPSLIDIEVSLNDIIGNTNKREVVFTTRTLAVKLPINAMDELLKISG